MRKQNVQAGAEGGADVTVGEISCWGWGGKRSVKLRVGGVGVWWEGPGHGAGDHWDFSTVLTTIRREWREGVWKGWFLFLWCKRY